MSEISELIKRANDGRRALARLFELIPKEMEARGKRFGNSKDWSPLKSCVSDLEYRRKPLFEPEAWKAMGFAVTYDNEMVHIGCRAFRRNFAKSALIDLVENNKSESHWQSQGDSYNFIAVRKGIKFMDDFLSWTDAERILKELRQLDGEKV